MNGKVFSFGNGNTGFGESFFHIIVKRTGQLESTRLFVY